MATPTSPKAEAAEPKSPISPLASDKATSPRATSPSTSAASAVPTSPPPPFSATGSAGSDTASPATTPAPAAPATDPAAPTARTPHANPKVAELQTMFPTVDVSVIEMVLESVGGSQDRAIESLLQMTDPDFKPDELATARQEESSQLDLDAEFARAIALQDEEEARQHRHARGPAPPANASRLPDVLPYQPRVRKPRRPGPDPYAGEHTTAQNMQERYGYDPAHPPPGQGDMPPGLVAFEEKVTAMAETGRQTFNTFMNRAKAKYNEYQSQQSGGAEAQARQAALYEQGPEPARQGGLWGETGRTSLGSRSTSMGSQHSQEAPAPVPQRRWHPSDAFDDPVKPVPPTGRRSPGPGGAASPDKAATGKIDLAKLGFLPKKRVDLMSTSPTPREDKDPNPHLPTSPTTGPTTPTTSKSLVDKIPKTPPAETSHHTLGDSDDDDDLDYTENPFDRR